MPAFPQHFYLYDNDSTDNTTAVLRPLLKRGLISMLPWPARLVEEGLLKTPQGQQLNHCFVEAGYDTLWMSNVDIDEFVVVLPQKIHNLPFISKAKLPFVLHKLLERLKKQKTGSLIMDRMNFGPNGHRAPTHDLSMVSFTDRFSEIENQHIDGKTIVMLETLAWMEGAHDTKMLEGFSKVTADLVPYERSVSRSRVFDPIRVNHYVTRSYAECIAKLTLNRWPENMDWRKTNSRLFCNKRSACGAASRGTVHMQRSHPPRHSGRARRVRGGGKPVRRRARRRVGVSGRRSCAHQSRDGLIYLGLERWPVV